MKIDKHCPASGKAYPPPPNWPPEQQLEQQYINRCYRCRRIVRVIFGRIADHLQ